MGPVGTGDWGLGLGLDNNQILAIKSKQERQKAVVLHCSNFAVLFCCRCCIGIAACRVNSRGPVLRKKESFGAYHQSYAKLKSLDNESVVTKTYQ